jgi:aryl-alcohol dehydrogenase-like predicted oxidoreductase
LLTGKHEHGAPEAGTRFDGNQAYLDRYWNDANLAAVRSLSMTARDAGRSLVSLSLNWLLHHTPVDCAVFGASRVEQFQQNFATLEDGPLDSDTLAECDSVWRRLRGVAPKYNR